MNQLAQDLRAAKALIDTPEKWIKEMGAHDVAGGPISIFSPDAVKFSIVGAYVRAAGRGNVEREFNMIDALRKSIPTSELMYLWNDAPERTHAEVMAAFDRAIEKAEADHA